MTSINGNNGLKNEASANAKNVTVASGTSERMKRKY